MDFDRPVTDVIIPVYEPGKELKELLSRLLKQTYPIRAVIIMKTERQYFPEEEYEALFKDKETKLFVNYLTKEEFDHGKTRHQGIMESEADICVCMTQDAVPGDRRLIEELVGALTGEASIAAAYARQLPSPGCGVVERYTRDFNYPAVSRVKSMADLETMGIKTYFCSNVCAAYKKDIYVSLGGFTRKTIFNEDMIYAGKAVQAGYKIAYAAEAGVIHSHNYTAMEQLHRNFDLAVSQVDHPEVFANISSEGEGVRLILDTASYLIKNGTWYLLPALVIKSGFKYMGYLLGKRYRRLPKCMILKLTMNRSYWKSL